MNTRRRTSLMRNLHYFEAVARHGSVTNAALELGVTAGAISHQLRELQEAMGEKLMERSGRGIALTVQGQRLFERLAAAFTQIEESVAEVIGGDRPVLRLAICSSFGPGWLINRLPSFAAAHPEIDLQLQLHDRYPQLSDSIGDAFVTTTAGQTGYWSTFLMEENLIAVRGSQAKPKFGSGLVLPLITTDIEDGNLGTDWIDYCKLHNVDIDAVHDGRWRKCSHYILAAEMARQGLGTALVPDFLVSADIRMGVLEAAGKHLVPANRSYYLNIKSSRRNEPALRALAAWFKDQMTLKSTAKLRQVV